MCILKSMPKSHCFTLFKILLNEKASARAGEVLAGGVLCPAGVFASRGGRTADKVTA